MTSVRGAGLTPRNFHELVIVSMTFNDQLACSIDGDLLCVFDSFINIWLKRPNSRGSPLSGDDEIH